MLGKGIGTAKAATLAAVFELGQRAVKEEVSRADMSTPEAVYQYLAGELRYEQQENFVVLDIDWNVKIRYNTSTENVSCSLCKR